MTDWTQETMEAAERSKAHRECLDLQAAHGRFDLCEKWERLYALPLDDEETRSLARMVFRLWASPTGHGATSEPDNHAD
jgi:chemotaxis regulatin CheY-phosphate phosphatase CheZ